MTVYAKYASITIKFNGPIDSTLLSKEGSDTVVYTGTSVVEPNYKDDTYSCPISVKWYEGSNFNGDTININNYVPTYNVTLYGKINKYKANNSNIALLTNGLSVDDLAKIDTSEVTDMNNLFRNKPAYYGGGISDWDVSNVTNMSYMFYGANLFNQNISSWDTSSVTNMSYMFYGASLFNQDLSSWDVSNVTNHDSMFENSGIASNSYY
ncbi:MAG: BspA family leucine-rich repeat surface protein, partial [Spirochaetia bacterium]|nr:BspA family leucine-rich repeat surface protein [Spirochaetia bacterium]